MKRKEKEITSRAAIDAVIEGCTVCHLAMAALNQPYLLPLAFGYDGRHIYFHTAPAGLKIEFLKTNPRVCFQMERNVELVTAGGGPCHWTFHFESVVGHGIAQEITDAAEKKQGLNRIVAHYGGISADYPDSALASLSVWRITIDTLTGKRSPMPAKL